MLKKLWIVLVFPFLMVTCSPDLASTPSQSTSVPSPETTATHTPSHLITGAFPDGYEMIFETDLFIGFVLPTGWQRISGSSPGVDYVEFTSGESTDFIGFRLAVDSEIGKSPNPYRVLKTIVDSAKSELGPSLTIVDQIQQVKVSGESASMVSNYMDTNTGDTFFSIMVTAQNEATRGYILQWSSQAKNENRVREIYTTMLPLFSFLPE